MRTIWGHPQQFESKSCVTSLAQGSEALRYKLTSQWSEVFSVDVKPNVSFPFRSEGSLGFRVMVKNLSHRFCLGWATMSETGRPCLGIFLLIFETFLGGALRHNVYKGYIVFWGTIIYCSLATYGEITLFKSRLHFESDSRWLPDVSGLFNFRKT